MVESAAKKAKTAAGSVKEEPSKPKDPQVSVEDVASAKTENVALKPVATSNSKPKQSKAKQKPVADETKGRRRSSRRRTLVKHE